MDAALAPSKLAAPHHGPEQGGPVLRPRLEPVIYLINYDYPVLRHRLEPVIIIKFYYYYPVVRPRLLLILSNCIIDSFLFLNCTVSAV